MLKVVGLEYLLSIGMGMGMKEVLLEVEGGWTVAIITLVLRASSFNFSPKKWEVLTPFLRLVLSM